MSPHRWLKSAFESLLRKARLDKELDEELASVLGLMVEEKIRAGVPPDEAVRQARMELGGVEQVKEKVREQRVGAGIESVIHDLRFGLRTLRRRPSFAWTAVAVLGVGIGAPSTVLTLVNDIFFQYPEQIVEPERVVRLTRSFGPGQGGGGAIGNPDYLYYRDHTSTLSGLAAYGEFRAVAYSLDGKQHDQLDVLFVSDNYFDILGVPAYRGRTFLPEENGTPGTHPVAVVSHSFWVRAMGSDAGAVGRSILLAGAPYRVIGIAPEGFGSTSPVSRSPDVWVPIAMYGALTRASAMDWWQRVPNMKSRWLVGLGRLAPGMTYEAAKANLEALGEALEYEGKSEGEGAFLQRQFLYNPGLESTLTSLSRMLLAVVGIVFLVATFNAAVLLLSRAATRNREMGIRTALGAGRRRIARQILLETLLLGCAGGLVGLLLAYLLSDLAASLLPVQFVTEFRPDGRVLAAAAALSFLTTLGVGLLPALQSAGRDPGAGIQDRGDGPRPSRLRNTLVVGQVGLSLILVAGAILFGRSFLSARTQELGFATENQLVLQVALQELDYGPEENKAFVQDALDRIRELQGVDGAAATRMIPFQGDWSTDNEAPPGAQPNRDGNLIYTGLNAVSPGYFSLAGIPVVLGRSFERGDVGGSTPVAILNEALAEAIWPGQNPLGRALPITGDLSAEVIGVAQTASYYELGESPQPQTYLALNQFPQRSIHFLVESAGSATELAPVVQTVLREMEPRLVFRWVTTMASVVEDETARFQVSAILVAAFGLVALLLAATGLYGTVSFLVARRSRDIGIRMALGANRGRVAAEVMRFAMILTSLGLGLGLIGSVTLRRFTESLLFGIESTDPLPLLGACLVLLGVSVAAAVAPARNATRVDPVEAIRSE
ncbi:MAG: ADOP family duplicated permease [Gemmatimonadota bacterium]|jgi:predicted permease